MGEELARRLDYCTLVEQPTGRTPIGYYLNYSMSSPERLFETEVAWFTHVEEADETLTARFFDTATKIDFAISHSERYARIIRDHVPGLEVEVISPGVDLDRFRPRPVRVGVVGRNYGYTPRKGDHLLRDVWDTPGIEFAVTGSGWSVPHRHLDDDELPDFYRSLDYLLIPSLWEGGPMSAIEALATGLPVIAPPVGWMPELPHLEYPTGDAAALRAVLRACAREREVRREAVLDMTWERFAQRHDMVFARLS